MANDSRFNVTFGEARFEEPLVITMTNPKPTYPYQYAFSFSFTYYWDNPDGSMGISSWSYAPGLILVARNATERIYHWLLTKDIFNDLNAGEEFFNYFAKSDHVRTALGVKITTVDEFGTTVSEVASNSYEIPFYVPDSMKPNVTVDIHPVNSVAKLDEWGIYVRGKSKVGFTVGASAKYGANLSNASFRVGTQYAFESSYYPAEGFSFSGEMDFDFYEYANVVAAGASDSRGFSTEITSDILVYDYAPPVIRDVIVYRCDANGVPDGKGTHLRVQCEADCTSLGGRNTITSVTARYGADTLGNAIALTNGVEQVIATGLDPNTTYTVELTVQDDVGETATETIVGDKPRTALHLKDGGKGFAIGKRSTEDGFHCGWDATFDKDVAILGGLTIGGKTLVDILYPVGSIYLTATGAHPASLFGGTWERIKDTFLLGAGDVYAAGDTGGAAEVTLLATQIPKHIHPVNGKTNNYSETPTYRLPYVETGTGDETVGLTSEGYGTGTLAGYAAMNSVYQAHKHIISVWSDSNTVGGGAHNNMPPYCVVNIWKRTA